MYILYDLKNENTNLDHYLFRYNPFYKLSSMVTLKALVFVFE